MPNQCWRQELGYNALFFKSACNSRTRLARPDQRADNISRRIYLLQPMFRFFTKSMHKPVLWLMLPLAVLAGRPTSGCLCGDGAVKASCAKTDWPFSAVCLASTTCCCDGGPSHAPACCPAQSSPNGVSRCSAGGCQCHALANHVNSVKLTKWTVEIEGLQFPVATAEVHVPAAELARHVTTIPAEVLPPPDRVVLFLHLTI